MSTDQELAAMPAAATGRLAPGRGTSTAETIRDGANRARVLCFKLICPSTTVVWDTPANAGFDRATVVAQLRALRASGHAYELIDGDTLSDQERGDLYGQAVRALARAGNRYRIRHVFGSRRHGGGDHLGSGVPALLVFEDGEPAGIYPHLVGDGYETIRGYLDALSQQPAATGLNRATPGSSPASQAGPGKPASAPDVMDDDLRSWAVREFGISIDDLAGPDDARSGAGVHPARTRDGLAAYLKLTPARLGSGMLDRARCELGFYRRLAGQVPVRTPRLLGALDADAGVALLLAAAGKQVNAEAWSDQAWAALGRDLAGLHAVAVSGQDRPGQDPLLKAMSEPVSDEVTEFWGEVLPELPELLASRDVLRAELAAQPVAFIHGDCHTGNIVHGPDGLVFCDWQSAGPGRATADLAHLSVRATPAGVTIPREMMTAYLDGRGGDAADLRRALVPAELAVFVFVWPPYAACNSQSGIERVHHRTRLLARTWLGMTSHRGA